MAVKGISELDIFERKNFYFREITVEDSESRHGISVQSFVLRTISALSFSSGGLGRVKTDF
jgi:hypothetical protein